MGSDREVPKYNEPDDPYFPHGLTERPVHSNVYSSVTSHSNRRTYTKKLTHRTPTSCAVTDSTCNALTLARTPKYTSRIFSACHSEVIPNRVARSI